MRRLWLALTTLVLLAGCAPPAGVALSPAPAPTPTVTPPISFPRDAGTHDSLTEWWYYTGHLASADGHEYGFEFTIFQVQREGGPAGYLSHFAVTDVDGQAFSHQSRYTAGELQPGFDFNVDGWRLTSDGTSDSFDAQMVAAPGAEKPYGLRLRMVDRKAPALHEGGYIEYGAAGGSYYYSRTRIQATGELRLPDGSSQAVSGDAWMDHQWGNFVVATRGGWDWFSLQMDDNTEVMLYVLRSPDEQTTAVYGSRVLSDGRTENLGTNTVKIEPLATWKSPHTGGDYPAKWRITFPDRPTPIVVTPRVADQELYFPGVQLGVPLYWEGAVSVAEDGSGRVLGKGYVELTGYAK